MAKGVDDSCIAVCRYCETERFLIEGSEAMPKGEAQQIILVCSGCRRRAKVSVEKIDWKYGNADKDRVKTMKDRQRLLEEEEQRSRRDLAERVAGLNQGILNLNRDLRIMREQGDDMQNEKLAYQLRKGYIIGLADGDAKRFKDYLNKRAIKSKCWKDGSWVKFAL